jgi:hypothetical protein
MNLSDIVASSKGRFVSVRFVKKDGTIRTMVCRLGVTKHLKGGKTTLDPSKYLIVFDVIKGEYRAINKDTILSVTFGGLSYV